ncbi:MAG: DUF488 domain-containing protein [Nitrospiraceae bacterium]|nr:MAG: DUF488 domain-containing protein [Nitrospiraceae bacterium]
MSKKNIYTLGTGIRSLEDFFEILESYDIETVIDVRSFPTSRLEHFKRKNLEEEIKEELLNYHYLGKELGGFRKGGYEQYTRTEDFEAGIDMIIDIASQKKSVIICAEHFPWKCHRRYTSRALQQRGWEIIHIIDKGKVWIPK